MVGKQKIKDLPKIERPREELIQYGPARLSNSELLAIILRSGKKGGGLKELLEKEIIDKKIFQWSEALRLHRNIGAYASEEKISAEDSRDLLDFTGAICDYVFVLSKKFDSFMKRKK